MIQVQRPLVIQTQLIRLYCPLETRLKHSSFRQHYYHQLHTTVTDDDIARLASRPLHPLTLADLVKYDILLKLLLPL